MVVGAHGPEKLAVGEIERVNVAARIAEEDRVSCAGTSDGDAGADGLANGGGPECAASGGIERVQRAVVRADEEAAAIRGGLRANDFHVGNAESPFQFELRDVGVGKNGLRRRLKAPVFGRGAPASPGRRVRRRGPHVWRAEIRQLIDGDGSCGWRGWRCSLRGCGGTCGVLRAQGQRQERARSEEYCEKESRHSRMNSHRSPPRIGERLADNGGWLTSRWDCVKKIVAVRHVRARQSASRESWVTNEREPIRA